MKVRTLALAVGGLVAAGVGAAVVYFDALVVAVITPRVPFGEVPPAPDYADPAAWSALPDRDDADDVALPGEPDLDPDDAPAVAFYVHPTSYVGAGWMSAVDDAELNAATDRVATRIQASALRACCAVWAPRYRQANMSAFFAPTPDGDRAREVAYGDVRDAFRAFLARAGDRPLVLAAHSQGSWLAARLLREEIAPGPLRDRLVVAYLPGMPIVDPGVPVCATPRQTGCVVSWNARGPRFQPTRFDIPVRGTPVCVNPLSWRADGVRVSASDNPGAVFFDATPPVKIPAFADAQCVDGTLVVTELGPAPRDFMSRLLDHAIGAQNHHPIEYQMYFESLRANAVARVVSFYTE